MVLGKSDAIEAGLPVPCHGSLMAVKVGSGMMGRVVPQMGENLAGPGKMAPAGL